MGTTVVAGRQGSESLLPGRIPDCNFARLSILFHHFNFKIDSNSRLQAHVKRPVSKPQQKRRFPDATVAHKQQLQKQTRDDPSAREKLYYFHKFSRQTPQPPKRTHLK